MEEVVRQTAKGPFASKLASYTNLFARERLPTSILLLRDHRAVAIARKRVSYTNPFARNEAIADSSLVGSLLAGDHRSIARKRASYI
jgi:hypothetical protein